MLGSRANRITGGEFQQFRFCHDLVYQIVDKGGTLLRGTVPLKVQSARAKKKALKCKVSRSRPMTEAAGNESRCPTATYPSFP